MLSPTLYHSTKICRKFSQSCQVIKVWRKRSPSLPLTPFGLQTHVCIYMYVSTLPRAKITCTFTLSPCDDGNFFRQALLSLPQIFWTKLPCWWRTSTHVCTKGQASLVVVAHTEDAQNISVPTSESILSENIGNACRNRTMHTKGAIYVASFRLFFHKLVGRLHLKATKRFRATHFVG